MNRKLSKRKVLELATLMFFMDFVVYMSTESTELFWMNVLGTICTIIGILISWIPGAFTEEDDDVFTI
jgi:hypothetical protein